MRFLSTLTLAFSLVAAAVADAAFFTADLPNPNASASAGQQVIVTGKGLEVGDLWLRAAHTQALIFRDRQGTGQIKIIGAIENAKSIPMMQKWGYTNIKIYNRTMSGNELLKQLATFKKIESLDFIGHNGALFGLALEDYNNRFYLTHAKELGKMRSRFSKNSVIRLFGCNTGWYLAPAIALATNVPTAGSFTYADVQQLHENLEWFYHDEGRFPEGSFLKTNPISFSENMTCVANGGCMRLKVVNSNYQGKHGSYGGTLPFLKFFCGGLDQNDCFRRMAKSTSTLISVTSVNGKPTIDQFAEIIADQFCPSWKDDAKRRDCKIKVFNYVMGVGTLPAMYSSVDGTSMTCDFKSCAIEKKCTDGSCVVLSTTKGLSKTYVQELNAYRAGFELL
jgi:hypothetical protein